VHDRRRFPQFEIAVDERRRAAGRIERAVVRRMLLAFGQVDEFEVERDADMRGDGANLPSAG
jgi:hypothetical protein